MENFAHVRICGSHTFVIFTHVVFSSADFTFVHSKFLAPLPSTLDEFKSSLCEVLPNVLDVNHLMKEISPLKKVNNLPASISYLKQRFFAPIDMEISNQGKYPQHHESRVRTIVFPPFFITGRSVLWPITSVI